MNSLFTLVGLGTFENVEEQEPEAVEHDVGKVWDVSYLCHSNERGPSASHHLKSLWESPALPMPTTAVEASQ